VNGLPLGLPLQGRRILVTRAAHQAGKLSDALRKLGAVPVEVPVLEIQPPASFDALDHALRQLRTYNWLIFTSANAVHALVDRASAIGAVPAVLSTVRVAAVGPATATAARDAGFQITFVPESYVAESLIRGLLAIPQSPAQEDFGTDPDLTSGARLSFVTGHDFSRADKGPQKENGALAPASTFAGQRILIARAAIARDIIPDALRAAGVYVDVVEAYRNVVPESAPQLLREAVTAGLDAATFTSSSSVTHLAEVAQKAGIAFPLAIPAVSIGPITSQTLRDANWPPAAEGDPSDIPGLAEAVAQFFKE
jgi:uroporphyrinogen-III synthase